MKKSLPSNMRRRRWKTRSSDLKTYYYYQLPRGVSAKRKLISLGDDYNEALRKYRIIENTSTSKTDATAVIFNNLKQIKKIAAVYFLLYKNEVVYVGKTTDLHMRIAVHRKENLKKFTHYSYIEAKEKDLDAIESSYIKALSPKHNGTSLSFAVQPCDLPRDILRI